MDQISHFLEKFKMNIVEFSLLEKTILLIVGLSFFLLSVLTILSYSYAIKEGASPTPTPAPGPPAIDSPQLLITKRFGNLVTIPPGGLSSSDAFCQLDERITGGGYGSSSPGVRVKDAQIVTKVTDNNVQLVGGEKWRINAYNDDPSQSVQLRAQVYCGKLIK